MEDCREIPFVLIENIELSALVSLSFEYRQHSHTRASSLEGSRLRAWAVLACLYAWSLGGNPKLKISTGWLTPFFIFLKHLIYMKLKFYLKQVFSLLIYTLFMAPCTINAATWADNGAYTISWYDKNQTSFDISTSQELAGLAYLVNNNFASFEGKTVYIQSDIDLSGREWIPIGTGSTIFQGTIEGNNATISNINIVSRTSNSPYKSGFWAALKNATISNLNLNGSLNIGESVIGVGFIAGSADNSLFQNININTIISYSMPNTSFSSSSNFSSVVGGVIGSSSYCTFTNVKSTTTLNYTFGAWNVNKPYGAVYVYCGGLVGSGSYSIFEKCHAINNFDIGIYGYETTSNYTTYDNSLTTFGGIVGSNSGSSSKIISCLAENKSFIGNHYNGTFDTKDFRYGGIVGYMSKDDNSTVKNCVAINRNYTVKGHSYIWQAAWYHTNSYFGGITYEAPKNFAGCYSNNDVIKNISMVKTDKLMENGSTSFSMSQMHSQSFVDELNFYSQLEFDSDNWELDEYGKLAIKQTNNNTSDGITLPKLTIKSGNAPIYNLSGQKVTHPVKGGIYIVSGKKVVVK